MSSDVSRSHGAGAAIAVFGNYVGGRDATGAPDKGAQTPSRRWSDDRSAREV